MNIAHKSYFWKAVLFALLMDVLVMGSGWWTFGGSSSPESLFDPSPTLTIGIPTLLDLLSDWHLAGDLHSDDITEGIAEIGSGLVALIVYLVGTGIYIGLLARSVQERDSSIWQEVKRSWLPLFTWMIVQVILGMLVGLVGKWIPLLVISSFVELNSPTLLGITGLVTGIGMLWFRYHFLYVEYSLILLQLPSPKKYATAVALRRANPKPALSFFFTNLIFNIALSLLINYFFSWPMLVAGLLINVVAQTWMQQRLLTHFLREADVLPSA